MRKTKPQPAKPGKPASVTSFIKALTGLVREIRKITYVLAFLLAAGDQPQVGLHHAGSACTDNFPHSSATNIAR